MFAVIVIIIVIVIVVCASCCCRLLHGLPPLLASGKSGRELSSTFQNTFDDDDGDTVDDDDGDDVGVMA